MTIDLALLLRSQFCTLTHNLLYHFPRSFSLSRAGAAIVALKVRLQ